MVCLDEDTQRIVQVVSPIHAESNEAELQNLKHGSYIVYLEVHVSLFFFSVYILSVNYCGLAGNTLV